MRRREADGHAVPRILDARAGNLRRAELRDRHRRAVDRDGVDARPRGALLAHRRDLAKNRKAVDGPEPQRAAAVGHGHTDFVAGQPFARGEVDDAAARLIEDIEAALRADGDAAVRELDDAVAALRRQTVAPRVAPHRQRARAPGRIVDARDAASRGDPQPPLRVDLQIANEAGRHVIDDVLEAPGRREPDQTAGVEAHPDVAAAILRERRRRGAVESLLRSERNEAPADRIESRERFAADRADPQPAA